MLSLFSKKAMQTLLIILVNLVFVFSHLQAKSDEIMSYVDKENTLHLMWHSVNELSETQVNIVGPKNIQTLCNTSYFKLEDLPEGTYDISVSNSDFLLTKQIQIKHNQKILTYRNSSSTLDKLEFVALDDSKYPEIVVQFYALDNNGNRILNMEKEQFSVFESINNEYQRNTRSIIDFFKDFYDDLIKYFDFMAPSASSDTKSADIIILFDTTGSMTHAIEDLKANINNFVDELIQNGIDARFKLISYKDDIDTIFDWTDDAEELKKDIENLQVSAGGTGPTEDGFEAMNIALDDRFRYGVQKIVMLFTDSESAEGTDDSGNSTPTKKEIIDKSLSRGVNAYVIGPNETQYNGEGSITDETNGRYYPISADFKDIAKDIGSLAGSIYHIAYKTPNVNYSKSNNQKKSSGESPYLNVNVKSGGKSFKHPYKRNLAPKIKLLKITRNDEENKFEILVKVSDPDKNSLKQVVMEYRSPGSTNNWKKIISKKNVILFKVPYSDLTGNQMEYRFSATDSKGATAYKPTNIDLPYIYPSTLQVEYLGKEFDDNLVMTVRLKISGLDAIEPQFFCYFWNYTSMKQETISISKNLNNPIYFQKEDFDEEVYKVIFKKNSLNTSVVNFSLLVKKGTLENKKTKLINYNLNVESYIRKNADTIILTNISKIYEPQLLKSSIQELINKTWKFDYEYNIPMATDNSEYNMLPIVIDLGNKEILNDGIEKFQIKIHRDLSNAKDASEIVGLLNYEKILHNFKTKDFYLVIIGDAIEIPHAKTEAYFPWVQETAFGTPGLSLISPGKHNTQSEWFDSTKTGYAINLKSRLDSSSIDDQYVAQYLHKFGTYPSDSAYRTSFFTGRIVGETIDLSSYLNDFIGNKGYALYNFEYIKNFIYISGEDENDSTKKYGFASVYNLDKQRDVIEKIGWDCSNSLFQPRYGLTGKAIINTINDKINSLIYIAGHSNHEYMTFSKIKSFEYYLNSCQKASEFRGGVNVSDLYLYNSIIFSVGCLSGIGYVNGLFPNEYLKKGLPIYVASITTNHYTPGKVEKCEKFYSLSMINLLNAEHRDCTVYEHCFQEKGIMESLGYSQPINEDICNRIQFYGIPNYRLGPRTAQDYKKKNKNNLNNKKLFSKSRKKAKSVTQNIIQSSKIQHTELGVIAELLFILNEKSFIYNRNVGSLVIHSITENDEYSRPALINKLLLPEGSKVTNFEISGEKSVIETYNDPIAFTNCTSNNCYSLILETNDFNEMDIVDHYISGNYLTIRVMPIQYKTVTKEALITKQMKINFDIQYPDYIPDTDDDGLPDYWEEEYQLDKDDPNGLNGPEGDPDMDDINNIEEYVYFTHPFIHNSVNQDTTPPLKPSHLMVNTSENSAEIDLAPDDDTASIQFYYGESKDFLVQSTPKESLQYIPYKIAGLKDNTKYFVAARAFDEAGNMSALSEAVAFTTPVGIGPDLPKNPSLDGLNLIIENPVDPDFKGYVLYTSLDDSFSDSEGIFCLPNKNNKETIIELSDSLIYPYSTNYVKVSAVDDNNHEGKNSNVFEVTESSNKQIDNSNDDSDGRCFISIINCF